MGLIARRGRGSRRSEGKRWISSPDGCACSPRSTEVATAESVATGTSLATVGRGSKSPDHHSRRAPRIALRDRALAWFEAGG
jgi:hypothetical protein